MTERFGGDLRPEHGGILCTHRHDSEFVSAAGGSEGRVFSAGFLHVDGEECGIFDVSDSPIAGSPCVM